MKATKLLKITFSLLLIAALLFSAGCKGPDAQTDGTVGSTGSNSSTTANGSTAATDSTEKEEAFVPVMRFVVTSDIHTRKESEDLQSH